LISYDTVSSLTPDGFDSIPTCVETGGGDTISVDGGAPAPGGVLYFLVRASNDCGPGSLGTDSAGVPRPGTACP
jgi:hypothetical protein